MTDHQSHVLVVEDEPSFAEALTVGLGREGFRVTVAGDGVAALERFAEVEPDLVLLDVMLPRLSGIDVCRESWWRASEPCCAARSNGPRGRRTRTIRCSRSAT
jgi:two-component system response regulator RegX3